MATCESNDRELLEQFGRNRDEAAFAELARRHLNLVYSAALRQLGGDTHSAEDVSQMVFAELARQAKFLVKHPMLAGWLYTTTRRMAGHVRRSQQRRQQREQQAFAMQSPEPAETPADWHQLREVLDEAMCELGEADRLALLARFFEGRELRQVGVAIGLSENAARMRVQRALEKLRGILARKGVATSVAGLAAALAANSVTAAPASLLAGVAVAATSAISVGGAAGLANLTTNTLLLTMKSTLTYTAAVILVGVPLVIQQIQIRNLRAELAGLRPDLAELEELRTRAGQMEVNRQAKEELALLKQDETELKKLRDESALLQAKTTNVNPAAWSRAKKQLTQAQADRDHQLAEAQAQALRVKRTNILKQIGLAAHVWALENEGRFPKSFEAMTNELGADIVAKGLTDHFEFFPQSQESAGKDATRIVFREKEARQMPNGQWERTYCYRDGSVQNIVLDTDDFAAWEEKTLSSTETSATANSANPPGGQ